MAVKERDAEQCRCEQNEVERNSERKIGSVNSASSAFRRNEPIFLFSIQQNQQHDLWLIAALVCPLWVKSRHVQRPTSTAEQRQEAAILVPFGAFSHFAPRLSDFSLTKLA